MGAYTTSCNTQSSAPEDGQNNCLKHVELTGIINKPLLLHLVGCLYYIQGDSGGICITLGNDSMSDSKQKSSYEHGSDFERLRSYGHFFIPVHALM